MPPGQNPKLPKFDRSWRQFLHILRQRCSLQCRLLISFFHATWSLIVYHGILQKQTFTQADPLSTHKSFVFFGTLLMETFKEKRKIEQQYQKSNLSSNLPLCVPWSYAICLDHYVFRKFHRVQVHLGFVDIVHVIPYGCETLILVRDLDRLILVKLTYICVIHQSVSGFQRFFLNLYRGICFATIDCHCGIANCQLAETVSANLCPTLTQ